MLQRGQAADAAGAAKLSNEGPVSVMTFGLLEIFSCTSSYIRPNKKT